MSLIPCLESYGATFQSNCSPYNQNLTTNVTGWTSAVTISVIPSTILCTFLSCLIGAVHETTFCYTLPLIFGGQWLSRRGCKPFVLTDQPAHLKPFSTNLDYHFTVSSTCSLPTTWCFFEISPTKPHCLLAQEILTSLLGLDGMSNPYLWSLP